MSQNSATQALQGPAGFLGHTRRARFSREYRADQNHERSAGGGGLPTPDQPLATAAGNLTPVRCRQHVTNAQKVPLSLSLSRFAQQKAMQEIAKRGGAGGVA
jgi:hypothetical protein